MRFYKSLISVDGTRAFPKHRHAKYCRFLHSKEQFVNSKFCMIDRKYLNVMKFGSPESPKSGNGGQSLSSP